MLDGADAGRIRRDVYLDGTALLLWQCRDNTSRAQMVCDRLACSPFVCATLYESFM